MIPLIRHQALLVILAGFVFLTSLGGYALFNDDESTNAGCVAEMFRKGAWIVPTFNQDLRTESSIIFDWFTLISFRLFGISEFSSRLPSSLLAVATTLLTYHLGRKLYSEEIGFRAGIILCTCLMFSAVGRSATPDSALVFFVTLAFTSYVWVVTRQRGGNFSNADQSSSDTPATDSAVELTDDSAGVAPSPRSLWRQMISGDWLLFAPMFAAMGFAMLAKGPVGFLLPCASIALFLLIIRRANDLENEKLTLPEGQWWRRWTVTVLQLFRYRSIVDVATGMRLLLGIGVVAAIVLPWYLIIGLMTEGKWLWSFLLDQNPVQLFLAQANERSFSLYHLYSLVLLLLGCLPWTIFLPVAVYQLWQRLVDGADWRDSDRLLACWVGVWFVFFSLITTRLPFSLLPIYPAIALIVSRYFYEWKQEQGDSEIYTFILFCRAFGAVGALMMLGLYIVAYVHFSSAQWIGLIGAVPVAGAFVALKFLDSYQREKVIQTLLVTAMLLAFLIVGLAPGSLGPYQDSRIFVAEARKIAKTDDIEIAIYNDVDPSLVFYVGKKIRKLDSPRQVADFIGGHIHSFVIAKASNYNELRDALTGDDGELSRHRRFLHGEEMILIGRK